MDLEKLQKFVNVIGFMDFFKNHKRLCDKEEEEENEIEDENDR